MTTAGSAEAASPLLSRAHGADFLRPSAPLVRPTITLLLNGDTNEGDSNVSCSNAECRGVFTPSRYRSTAALCEVPAACMERDAGRDIDETTPLTCIYSTCTYIHESTSSAVHPS